MKQPDVRTFLIHGYFAIDPAVVWAVAADDLAGLVDDLEGELARLGRRESGD